MESSLLFASVMFVNLSVFVFHAGASRILGVQDFGALYALMAILPLIGIPSMALATVVTKFAAEFRTLHDDSHIHALVRSLTIWLAVGSSTAVVASLVLRTPFSTFFHVSRGAIVAAGALTGVTLAIPPFRAVLQGLEDFRQYAASSALEAVLKTGLGILFAVLGFGIAGALAGSALGTLVALAYTWVALKMKYCRVAPGPLHLNVQRVLQTSGGALVLIATLAALSYGDALIVKHYMSPSESGLYAAVSLGGKALLYLTSFIPLILLPKATTRATRGSSAYPILASAGISWALLSALGIAAFYLVPGLIIRVLVGSQFMSAAPLLLYYAVAMALLGGMNVAANYKIALHRFDFVWPYALLTGIELVAIVLHHPDLRTVIGILVAGNAAGLAAGLYRITRLQESPVARVQSTSHHL